MNGHPWSEIAVWTTSHSKSIISGEATAKETRRRKEELSGFALSTAVQSTYAAYATRCNISDPGRATYVRKRKKAPTQTKTRRRQHSKENFLLRSISSELNIKENRPLWSFSLSLSHRSCCSMLLKCVAYIDGCMNSLYHTTCAVRAYDF